MYRASDACDMTVPELLDTALSRWRNSRALHWREAGSWRHLSSEDLASDIRRMALAFNDLGVTSRDGVGLLADPSPGWLAADLAAMTAGGVTVPLFPSMSAEHLLYVTMKVKIRVLVVIGPAGWALAQPHLARWRRVIVRGVPGATGRNVTTWHEALTAGDRISEQDPGRFHRLLSLLKPTDPATILFTSGSTGTPKGVVLTHRNLCSQIHAACLRFPLVAGQDRALSCLPLAHVFERTVMYTYIAQGAAVWFADDVKQVGPLMREVKPTVMTMVPRLLEKLHARIVHQVEGSGPIRRQLGRWALELATHQRQPEEPASGLLAVADRLVYRKMRQALGGSLRYLIVGGAPLAPALERFLLAVDLPVYVGYGLTEASPVLACNHPGDRQPGTVGPAFPGVELRIADDGEILARGPNIMAGYLDDPEATAATVDAQGWLHTGDLGSFDDRGHLRITGRAKELFKTANGKYVAPVPIEQAVIAASGLVDQAMVVAEGRRFVGALLVPDIEAIRQTRERLGLPDQPIELLLEAPALRQEVEKAIGTVNDHLDRWERIRAWRWMPSIPSIEKGEMTPTHKLRRHILCRTHAGLIEEMYRGSADDPG